MVECFAYNEKVNSSNLLLPSVKNVIEMAIIVLMVFWEQVKIKSKIKPFSICSKVNNKNNNNNLKFRTQEFFRINLLKY